MQKEEIINAIETSERMSQLLLHLADKVLTWAEKKEKLYKLFDKEIKNYKEIIEKMPEDWVLASSNQFAAGKIFAAPSKLKKFLNQYRNFLSREEKQVIRYFLENPWFYSLFSVEKTIGKNFLKIYDYSKNCSLLLFSKGVQEMYRYGAKLFLCLLFNNGECHQTNGTINYFRGFTTRDFKCFAGLTSHHFKKNGDLSYSIYHNPVPYMMLYSFAELPPGVFKGEPMEYCSHSINVEQFIPAEYSKVFDIQEKEGVVMCRPKGKNESGDFNRVYFDKKKGTLHIHTVGIKRYQSIIKCFKGKYDFPAEPSWRVSAQMEVAIETILGIKPPVLELEKIFKEEPDPVLDEQLNRLNAMFMEMTENYNRGLEFSTEGLAKKYDFPSETVMQMQEDFKKYTEKYDIDIQGGFEDYTPPPPEVRMRFSGRFQDNSLFEFRASPMAEGYFGIKLPGLAEDMDELEYETLTLNELPAFIEDLYFEHWNTPNCTILFYTIYLLSKEGEIFLDVRDYAVEVLRLFWQIILPTKEEEQIEKFIKSYSFFCFDVLYRVGLIDIDRKIDEERSMDALFKIKASPFFYEWIRFIQSH